MSDDLFGTATGPRKVYFYPSTRQPWWRRLLRRPKPLPYFFGTAMFDVTEDGTPATNARFNIDRDATP